MKIAAYLTTPKWQGGVETAFEATVKGLRELGHDVTTIGCVFRDYKNREDFVERAGWRELALNSVDVSVRLKSSEVLENLLSKDEYDAVLLSNLWFVDRFTPEVLVTSDKIAPWVSGWHTNVIRPAMVDWHRQNAESKTWTGNYVHFWESSRNDSVKASWYKTVLPYISKIDRDNTRPLSQRTYDFAMTSRVDPQKGVVAYLAALNELARRGADFVALLAGSSTDLPGGPYSYGMSQLLENWGWTIHYETKKMRSRWVASHFSGATISFTGDYEPSDLSSILSASKIVVNSTSHKASNSHLEYSTMEAIDAGCYVVASDDWDSYHYGTQPPDIVPIPKDVVQVRRGNRALHNDLKTPETTYTSLADTLEKLLLSLPADEHPRLQYNRSVLDEHHAPVRAAATFIDAINSEPLQ